MEKLPWGIFAGIFAILVSLCTVGFVAGYIILDAIEGATNSNAGLFGTWWQTAVFVADILFAVCFAMSVFFRIKFRKRKEDKV